MSNNIYKLIFLLIWVVTLIFSFTEVYYYRGFIGENLFFNLDYFIILTIGLGRIYRSKDKKKSIFNKLLLTSVLILVFTIPLIAVFFAYIEASNEPNYVYTHYHLHHKNLFWSWLLCLYFYILTNLCKVVNRVRASTFIILVLIVFVLVSNFSKISGGVVYNLYYLVKHPFLSYDDKMRKQTGKLFYDYILFVKNNTPEKARILIPPQGYPWPQTGNIGYLRYFLYPRYLLNGNEYEPGIDLNKEGINYVLIVWGESEISEYGFTNGWPKFNLKNKYILYFDPENEKIQTAVNDYVYKNEIIKKNWGLISL